MIQDMTKKEAAWFIPEVERVFKRSGKVLPKWDSDE